MAWMRNLLYWPFIRSSIRYWWTWWRHQMETFSALLAICTGNSPGTGEFPAQRPVKQSFDVFSDLRLNKRLSNNREAGDLRRYRGHYDVTVMYYFELKFHKIQIYCSVKFWRLKVEIMPFLHFFFYFNVRCDQVIAMCEEIWLCIWNMAIAMQFPLQGKRDKLVTGL